MDNSLSQPYEVKSFSGGITDFFLQAPNTYYEKADNFVVNNDLKLEVRSGSFLWDALRNNHILDSVNPRRIDNFMLFRDESILLAHSGRDIFYPDFTTGAWTKLVGPTGNEAFSEGGPYSFSTQAQWNGHLFVTSNAASLPSKIYLDENGVMRVRSVGLPPAKNAANANNQTTLAACINLANDLRTSMLNHFLDASYSEGNTPAAIVGGYLGTVPPNTGTALHYVQDKSAATYLATQTGTIAPAAPSPLPTPAPAATDLASLYTLVVALCKASQQHILDANTVSPGTPVTGQVHYMNRVGVTNQAGGSGPNVSVTNAQAPTTLEEARTRLNDIRKYWEWHRLALGTHIWYQIWYSGSRWWYGFITSYDKINRYPLTYGSVPSPQADGLPIVTPNYGKFIAYVNMLKYLANGHLSNGAYMSANVTAPNVGAPHARNPGITLYELPAVPTLDAYKCELPDATDFDSACLTLYWIRSLYAAHYGDAIATTGSTGFTFTSVAGSANITAVTSLSGTALTLPVGLFGTSQITSYAAIGLSYLTGPVGENGGAIVTASASGTATLSKPALYNATGVSGMYGASRMHFASAFGSGGFLPVGTSSSIVSSDEAISNPSAVGATTSAWYAMATEFYTAIVTHTNNLKLHNAGGITLALAASYLTSPEDTLPPAIGTFIYALVYKLTYSTVDGVQFVEYSNPVQVGATCPVNYPIGYSPTALASNFLGSFGGSVSATNIAQYGTVISGIPVLANTSKTNYDLSKIQVLVFRTINAGTTFYLLATLANGTTTYTDTTNDTIADTGLTALNTRETLYTTGGVVGFDPPPRSKFVHILQGTAIYGGTYDGDQSFPNRILQSIPGTPAATNLTFYDNLDEAVTGISSTGSNFIAFTLTKCYRITGGFNELGQGNLSHEKISDNVGCISASSIVQTDLGLYFAGSDGFYYTDGYSVTKVSSHLDKTYQMYTQTQNQRDRIQGTYDRQFRRVYWTMQGNPTGADCGYIFILHTGYGSERSAGVFTSWVNGSDFMPSAITYYKNQLVRGDYRGVVYYHSPYSKTDPAVPTDLTISAAAWNTSYIPYRYKSAALDFNTTFKGQWATRFHLTGKNVGNAGIQVSTVREIENQKSKDFSPVFYNTNLKWGDPSLNWGDASIIWQYDLALNEWRRFPAQSIRSQFRQIEIKPGYIVTNKYDDYPTESFAGTNTQGAGVATVDLVTPTGYSSLTWPLDVVGQTIAFDLDGYTLNYTITGLTNSNTRISISDPTNSLSALPTGMKWQISGYLKEQRFQLSGYDIHFGFLGQRGSAAGIKEGGGNG